MAKKPSPKETRIIRIFYAIAGIAFGIYSLINTTTLTDKNLKKIEVTILKNPKYEQSTVKTTTYYNLYIFTKEFTQPFNITGFVYKSIDHKKIRNVLIPNQKIWIKIDENDINKSNKESVKIWEIGINEKTLSEKNFINNNITKEKHIGILVLVFGIYNLIYLFFEKNIRFNYKHGTYIFYAIMIIIILM